MFQQPRGRVLHRFKIGTMSSVCGSPPALGPSLTAEGEPISQESRELSVICSGSELRRFGTPRIHFFVFYLHLHGTVPKPSTKLHQGIVTGVSYQAWVSRHRPVPSQLDSKLLISIYIYMREGGLLSNNSMQMYTCQK